MLQKQVYAGVDEVKQKVYDVHILKISKPLEMKNKFRYSLLIQLMKLIESLHCLGIYPKQSTNSNVYLFCYFTES